ncbi:spore protease YyaC [Paenibacillus sp. SC116]|uniref:spore protease YyaC n=1 Tax=Paenibacillus sp. SC116 TaxID=2968986 RepID=UPI00215AFAEB|nr:spore protease YyaC [Paenibacillus sp. SC116]MCR8844400.1 spore protease YyaC [Paenibacillus sp. SC116]
MSYPFFQRPSSSEPTMVKLPYDQPESFPLIINACMEHIKMRALHQPVAVVCIGTDRSTGDCLGPLVGSRLERLDSYAYHLYGTLAEPVHAVNLQQKLQQLNEQLPNAFVIAVDACLGQSTSVGLIQVQSGPVKPGAGVNKQLPPVGDMHLTGIVNIGGFMEYFVLQNTRLHLVMNMADIIADALHQAIIHSVRAYEA